MFDLACKGNLAELGIKTYEGWNITAFLDHIEKCTSCSQCKEVLIEKLNEQIGGSE
jgi:hypothetical protein